MTALTDPIVFNAGSGSDTTASGSGSVALSGTGASTNNTTAVDVSADSVDTSGILAGDLFWVDSTAGRQFSVIASVDSGTDIITCDDTFTQTESTRNWGIGGSRADIDGAGNRTLFSANGAKATWIIELEDNQTISSALDTVWAGGTGVVTIRGNSSAAVRTINNTANDYSFDTTGCTVDTAFENLKITNSNGTKTNAWGIRLNSNSRDFKVRSCILGDATNTLKLGFGRGASWTNKHISVFNTEIGFCTTDGIDDGGAAWGVSLRDCWIHDCVNGIGVAQITLDITNTIISDNSGDGIVATSSTITVVGGCIIYNNGGDGIDLSGAVEPHINILDNIITNNGGYGINAASGQDEYNVNIDYNSFKSNTSGALNNITAGANDTTLTADPYVDAASDDYNINNTAGGGAALRAVTRTLPS